MIPCVMDVRPRGSLPCRESEQQQRKLRSAMRIAGETPTSMRTPSRILSPSSMRGRLTLKVKGFEHKETKFLIFDDGHDVLKKFGKYPYAVWCNGADNNSIQYVKTPYSAHSVCCWSTRSTVTSLSDWLPTETMSTPDVRVSFGPLMAELWLKWMSTAPCLMWKPLSAT